MDEIIALASIREFGQWKYSVDVIRTGSAYAATTASEVDSCDCLECQNYRLVRDQIFLGEPSDFLRSLGIDYRKEGNNSRLVELAPGEHLYSGWFHFVGELLVSDDFPEVYLNDRVDMSLCKANAPHLRALRGLPLVQIEFQIRQVPWMLPGYERSY